MRKTIPMLCVLFFAAACNTPPPPPPAEKPVPAVAEFDSFTYTGHDAVYDHVKAGPGQYLNPILPGYYPDPSIVRVGEDYYLVNSTFMHFPGLPVWHSRDLVHWKQIGNAVDRPSQIDFGKLEISRGLFAPAISHHDGTYYIINTCVDCGGNFIITAKDPAGPWSDPVWFKFGDIDPSLFFDDDSRAYIVNNGLPAEKPRYEGHRAIWLQEVDLNAGKMTGPRKVLVNGGTDIAKKPIWIEGPHLYRINGWYYLMCAEGGTGDQHSEVIFRSRKLWGPYVPYKGNPILTQRDLDPARPYPVTSTGHADLVETQNGEWFAVFLGTRPYGDDLYNTGRETFMLPVTWKKGWPLILEKGKPVPFAVKRPDLPPEAGPQHAGNYRLEEDFKGPLDPAWLMLRTPHEKWYATGDGTLRLTPRPVAIGSDGNPSFLGLRQQHADATASIVLRFDPKINGERAGLVALQNSNAFWFLGVVREKGETSVCLFKRASKDEPENGVEQRCVPAPPGPVELQIAIHGGKADFGYGTPGGEWQSLLLDADATILSTKKAGGFVGTVIGPYAYTPQ